MSIDFRPETRLFIPGGSFDVTNPAELEAIEYELIHEVDPQMSPEEEEVWSSHVQVLAPLQDFRITQRKTVTIPRLHGVVMDHAYEIAHQAGRYGWEMAGSRPHKVDATGNLGKFTVGLLLQGEVPAAGGRLAGRQVQKAVWYVPSLTNFRSGRGRSQKLDLTVRRYVTHPRFVD